uniref:Vitamin K epoxide reductase domain-containing protein n=1 Tax=Paulinella longichromatophora TaxID=1708747 RepID=A0A2H4ZNE2_9EUKA|nr:hypothetical protein PLO_050 [Paulinella longichromatophora]
MATIGVIDTGTITLAHWGWISNFSCNTSGQGCERVLQSSWGFIFGQPLSVFGLIAYSMILVSVIMSIIIPDKQNIEFHRWSRRITFLVSSFMATFSLLLMSLLIFKIKAFCFFCFLSATLSITLLLLNAIRIPRKEYDQLIVESIVMSLLVGTFGLVWALAVDFSSLDYSKQPVGIPPEIINSSDSSKIALAEFLNDSNDVLYSIYWCPHCHDQKELFGKQAIDKLTIIECAREGKDSEYSTCKQKGITGFPSWDIKNKSYSSNSHALPESGIKSLNQLAELSGYKRLSS